LERPRRRELNLVRPSAISLFEIPAGRACTFAFSALTGAIGTHAKKVEKITRKATKGDISFYSSNLGAHHRAIDAIRDPLVPLDPSEL
jgi:hypothetical protein